MPLTLSLRRWGATEKAPESARRVRVDSTDVQALALHGHDPLRECRYFLLKIRDARAARGWLEEIAPAVGRGAAPAAGTALQIAITHSGLRALGLRGSMLAAFSREFAEGMVNDTRSPFLGDVDGSSPALWRWGGPNNPPVHVLLAAYADTVPRLVGLLGHVHASLLPGGLSKIIEIETARLPGSQHFQLADGGTPPMLEGHRPGPPESDMFAPGELLLGYPNRRGLYAARPLLEAALDPMARLCLDREGSPKHDLGQGGSYLVFRQIRQNAAAFRRAREEPVFQAQGELCDAPSLRVALRSRSYGAPLPEDGENREVPANDTERGVCFVALNTDLSAQFELSQRWWLLEPKYSGLFGELAPIAVRSEWERGPASELGAPLRLGAPRSLDVVGGAYFFLPSLRALRYLAELST